MGSTTSSEFLEAVRDGRLEIVKGLLHKEPHLVQAADEVGWTALHFAAFYGHLDLLKFLVANGVHIGALDADGQTAADVAKEEGKADIVTFLAVGHSTVFFLTSSIVAVLAVVLALFLSRQEWVLNFLVSASPVAVEESSSPPNEAASKYAKQMVELGGGTFTMGTDDLSAALFDEMDGESPARKVRISRPFRLGKFAVSNAHFAEFVLATGYVTDAEKFGWSFVFEELLSPEQHVKSTQAAFWAPWWVRVDGANWLHPQGPDSTAQPNNPVTQMSFNDAEAFCKWALPKGRLPTEAEWEYAAKGGLENARFPWGDEMVPNGVHRMNMWHSSIPKDSLPSTNFLLNGEYYIYPDEQFLEGNERLIHLLPPESELKQRLLASAAEAEAEAKATTDVAPAQSAVGAKAIKVSLKGVDKAIASVQVTQAFYRAGSSQSDGFVGLAPVDAYGPQNAFGMFNMAGNVWEWVGDWWTNKHHLTPPLTVDPKGPAQGKKKVLKGGSFICNWLTCPRMRPSGRKGLPADSGSDSLGFRCAADI